MNIDILLPTRARTNRVEELLDSIEKTADDLSKIFVYFYVDDDDTKTIDHISEVLKKYSINISFIIGERIVLSEAWNKLWKESNSEILMLCADDVRFESSGWDTLVREQFEKSKDKILFVFGNDGITPKNHYGEGFGTHGFVSRKSTEILNYFVPPYFACNFNDTWINTLYGKRGWNRSYQQKGPERGVDRKVELYDEMIIKHYHCSVYGEYADSTEGEMRGKMSESTGLFFSKELTDKRIEDIEKLKKHLISN